jgi:hypothetical protein
VLVMNDNGGGGAVDEFPSLQRLPGSVWCVGFCG